MILQLEEEPIFIKLENETTSLFLQFASKTIEVLEEVPAYPFLSLVADVGGVLGLFIGFNFLMLWDWIVWGLERMKIKNFNIFM